MNFIEEKYIDACFGGAKEEPLLKSSQIIGDNMFKKVLSLKISIDPSILGPNFREELANAYKTKYENKVLYLFYIVKIHTEPLLNKELPLISSYPYIMTNNLPVEVYTVSKDTIVELSILVYNYDNNIYVRGQNKYINCKILPSSEYKIVQKITKYEIIFEDGNLINERDKAFVKITNVFSSNECETEYIICEGEFNFITK